MTSTTNHTAPKPGFFARFRSHPASVGESYFGHMLFALRFAGKLFQAGGAAVLHAVMPPLCESTASRIIGELHDMCQARHGAQ